VLSTIVGATVGLAGFVVTVTVLAIQMATGTFSARYMRIWYRDPMLKGVLTVLAGTMTFAFSLLRQVGSTKVPNIGVSVAGLLLVLSLVLFPSHPARRRSRPRSPRRRRGDRGQDHLPGWRISSFPLRFPGRPRRCRSV
jgi:hypothetical protein